MSIDYHAEGYVEPGTYEARAMNWRLWQECVDADATMTESEFDTMSVDEKIALQVKIWGPEPTDETEADD